MILYVDTSALVPLLIEEPTSAACGELWDAADSVVVTRLAYVETTAALAMAGRMARISEAQASEARSLLDDLWVVTHVIELGPSLMEAAARSAVVHGLKGYDAVHCAAGVSVNDVDLVAASGDQQLIAAWRAEGLAVRDTGT